MCSKITNIHRNKPFQIKPFHDPMQINNISEAFYSYPFNSVFWCSTCRNTSILKGRRTKMSSFARKPVLGFPTQTGLYTATEDSQRLEISDLGSRETVLSMYYVAKTKVLISKMICICKKQGFLMTRLKSFASFCTVHVYRGRAGRLRLETQRSNYWKKGEA